jgi:ATP-dependent DNA helicase DinG
MIESVIREVLSRFPGAEHRPQQLEMARLIESAIAKGRHALIEAGTGSGKSFGYLLPILESGKKAVISTGTIALQEQLLSKDIPFLQEAYRPDLTVAIAKGRSNYVCLRKLWEADQRVGPFDPLRSQVDGLLARTGEKGWSGDKADLDFVVDWKLWADELASDREDCLGPRCPNYMVSPHRIARIKCDDAELIIANHALYFTDLVTNAGVLPKHDLVVFDEAHHLERAATSALSVQIGRWSGVKLLQRVRRRFPQLPISFVDALEEAESRVREWVFRQGSGQRPLDGDPAFAEAAQAVGAEVEQLVAWIGRAGVDQMTLIDDSEMAKQRAELQKDQLQAMAQSLVQRWVYFADIRNKADRANWMQVDATRDSYELRSAPLDVGDMLRNLLWSKRTAVLTSATLAVDGGFDFIKRELGIDDAVEAVLGSPFDFPNQAFLYVPRHLPLPSDPDFIDRIIPEIEQCLHWTRGRAFVLFTSYKAMREVAQRLGPRLPYPSKTQEELPRQKLIDWFKATPHSVLFATATFWEGVDVPGSALSCVIIDKLPFASPDDPVVQARTERLKEQGRDWFEEFMLPKAILALKQGFGRLIRTRTDRGLVAILDRRLVSYRYGDTILRSLPPARRIDRIPDRRAAVAATAAPQPVVKDA